MAIGTKGRPPARFDAKSELASAEDEGEVCFLCGGLFCDGECDVYDDPWEGADPEAEAAVPYLTCWLPFSERPRPPRHPATTSFSEALTRATSS